MTEQEVMAELEAMGTAQNRKIYQRHGAQEPLFGVSYANLGVLRKRIKRDQPLAEALWATGNHDARVLATMIADPKAISHLTVDTWTRDLNSYPVADAVAGLVAKTPFARACVEPWVNSDEEWVERCGWHLIGQLAMTDKDLPDAYFTPYLARIADTIHGQKNRVREAMNNALIAIGGRNDSLANEATRVAKAIGTVHVDHGETGCRTPNPRPYIQKMRDRAHAKSPAVARA